MDFDNMYLNRLHSEHIDDRQSILSRNSKSYSNSAIGIDDNMPIALIMIAIITGICIICGCIILIFYVCVGGCVYFDVNKQKMPNGLEESDICNV